MVHGTGFQAEGSGACAQSPALDVSWLFYLGTLGSVCL